MKKYWYVYYHYECPACGSCKTYKERVYTKPKPEDRHKIENGYDYCLEGYY